MRLKCAINASHSCSTPDRLPHDSAVADNCRASLAQKKKLLNIILSAHLDKTFKNSSRRINRINGLCLPELKMIGIVFGYDAPENSVSVMCIISVAVA